MQNHETTAPKQSTSTQITIIDAVMGTGKSSWIINHIIRHPHKKFVVVLPLLMEVERYETELKEYRPVYS